MQAISDGKFLGVGSGSSSRGMYYNITIFDGEGPIKCRATEEVFNKGQRIAFGAAVQLTINIGTFNGNPTVRIIEVEET